MCIPPGFCLAAFSFGSAGRLPVFRVVPCSVSFSSAVRTAEIFPCFCRPPGTPLSCSSGPFFHFFFVVSPSFRVCFPLPLTPSSLYNSPFPRCRLLLRRPRQAGRHRTWTACSGTSNCWRPTTPLQDGRSRKPWKAPFRVFLGMTPTF